MSKSVKSSVRLICAVIYAVGVRLVRKYRPRVVLYYHGVDTASMEGFRKQIAYLARECRVVKLCDISRVSNEKEKTIVALTFDDAYTNLLDNAIPVLKEHGLPAAIFVPTGHIGQRPGWAMAPDCPEKDEFVMDEQQIVTLDKEGYEILSHTVSHSRLTELEDTDLEMELSHSKQRLEQILGHEVPAVSYPHGSYDARVYRATQKAGYQLGFTTYPNIVDNCADELRIGRFEVSPRDSMIAFKLKANGAYQANRCLINLKRLLVHRNHWK